MQVQQQSILNLGEASKSSSTSVANNSTRQAQGDDSFQDQLDKQVDRTKNDNIQDDRSESNARDATQDEPVARPDSDSDGQSSSSEDSENEQTDAQAQVAEDELSNDEQALINPLIANPLLPGNGNTLPPSGLQISATSANNISTNNQTVLNPLAQSTQTEQIDIQNINPQQAVKTDIENSLKPVNYATNLLNNAADKITTQNNQYTNLESEMPTGEALNRATQMQQVPVTTLLSSNNGANNAPPNLVFSSGLTTETTGLATTSLTNGPATSSTFSPTINASIQNPNWSQQMTQQVSLMVKGGIQQAEIKLNPAHLGPMEIKLSIKDDQANVQFIAQQAPVRDALDSAIPRLREMLEQQGLNLANVDVSSQSQQNQTGDGARGESSGSNGTQLDNAQVGEAVEQTVNISLQANSGLSIYA